MREASGIRRPAGCTPARQWRACGPLHLLEAIRPLAQAWRARGAQVLLQVVEGDELIECLKEGSRLPSPPTAPLARHASRGPGEGRGLHVGEPQAHATAAPDARGLDDVAARAPSASLLVLEDPSTPSLRAAVEPEAVDDAQGAALGWLRLSPGVLAGYAERASALLRREACAGEALPVAWLAPREARYLGLLDELAACDAPATGQVEAFRWSAERIRKPVLMQALRSGLGAALFAGHGTRDGWLAYGGMSASTLGPAHVAWPPEQTIPLVFSLACAGGQPGGWADTLVARGMAGGVLAPLRDPLHEDNRQLAHALWQGLAQGLRQADELLAFVRSERAWARGAGYVWIGDPALPAAAMPQACLRAREVPAPSADHWRQWDAAHLADLAGLGAGAAPDPAVDGSAASCTDPPAGHG